MVQNKVPHSGNKWCTSSYYLSDDSIPFKKSMYDDCIFWKRDGNKTIYIILYVDDFLILGKMKIKIFNS